MAISLIILSSCSEESAIKKKPQIVGLWKLHIIEAKDSLNKWKQTDWMKNGEGLLHYDDKQTVSVHFAPQNYGKADSLKAYWYVASYIYRPDSHFVMHTRILHSNPSDIGKIVKRDIEIKEDTLIMNAKEFGFRLKWIKQ